MAQQGGSMDWQLLPLGFCIYLSMPDLANQCLLNSFTPFPLGPSPYIDLHILMVVSHNFYYFVNLIVLFHGAKEDTNFLIASSDDFKLGRVVNTSNGRHLARNSYGQARALMPRVALRHWC